MLFNSFDFLIFLPVVFILYWFLFNKKLLLQNILLLLSSYFFYAWWSKTFLGLLILSTILDYLYGFGVASQNKQKSRVFLWLSIVNNLGILCLFKYYNFFVGQAKNSLELIGVNIHPIILSFVLPIGISFYTFHGMSYVFDIYHKRQRPIKNLIDYSLFVSFFPLLVAGPIERANHLLPQIQKKRFFDYYQAIEGCRLILWGMFKKVVIADNLAVSVDEIYRSYQSHTPITLLLNAVAFSFQIYCDFSGYSDIALGTAKLFGFELLSNFKFPYFSRDVAEFWRRWHISLSTWFRDYVYIPLGGSKNGTTKAIINTFIIFLISGFWHGASWSFIIWGLIHAIGFLPLLLSNRNRVHVSNVVAQNKSLPSLHEFGQMFLTFSFVTIAWIFFRAENISVALSYISHMIYSSSAGSKQFPSMPVNMDIFIYIFPLLLIDWFLRRDERKLNVPRNFYLRNVIYILLSLLVLVQLGKVSNFIYFQF